MKLNNVQQTLGSGYGNSNWWFGSIAQLNNLTLGVLKDSSGESNYFQGKIARVIAYDTVNLSAGDINTIYTQLSSLYGIS